MSVDLERIFEAEERRERGPDAPEPALLTRGEMSELAVRKIRERLEGQLENARRGLERGQSKNPLEDAFATQALRAKVQFLRAELRAIWGTD